jgi:acetyl esterase
MDVPGTLKRISCRSLEVAGATGPLQARLYEPSVNHTGGGRLLVFFHGGGCVVGDLDTHDSACRFLCDAAGVSVLSVDYRLAPEHPFPAAVDDTLAAFRWSVENAQNLNVDLRTIAAGGDSAGANLAAVVSQVAHADGGSEPAFQLLLYPVTDVSRDHPSRSMFATGFYLWTEDITWVGGHYLPDADSRPDPRASPLLARDLSGLPPADLATVGFDPLRDEGEAYAQRLADADVPVALRRHPSLIHGFANLFTMSRTSSAALAEAAGALRTALALARADRHHHQPRPDA